MFQRVRIRGRHGRSGRWLPDEVAGEEGKIGAREVEQDETEVKRRTDLMEAFATRDIRGWRPRWAARPAGCPLLPHSHTCTPHHIHNYTPVSVLPQSAAGQI